MFSAKDENTSANESAFSMFYRGEGAEKLWICWLGEVWIFDVFGKQDTGTRGVLCFVQMRTNTNSGTLVQVMAWGVSES